MKKIKEIYSQPQCETLVVRFEGNIMSNGTNNVNRTEYLLRGESDDDVDIL